MARTRKLPEERRAEIVSAARQLFMAKGVERTSVSDIVKAVGVAQGTFYWHFESKDDLLNVVVGTMTSEMISAIVEIADSERRGALEKMGLIQETLGSNALVEGELVDHFHREEHHQMHDEIAREMTKHLIPPLSKVIEQGIDEGVFVTAYPHETAAFIVAAAQIIHEDGFFKKGVAAERRLAAYFDFILKGLSCKKET